MDVNQLRYELDQFGSAVFTDVQGRKLILVASSHLQFVPAEQRAILVAYEGEGAFLWDTAEKISPFRLIEAGFSIRLAPTLAGVLNGLIEPRKRVERPLLESPKGAEKEN